VANATLMTKAALVTHAALAAVADLDDRGLVRELDGVAEARRGGSGRGGSWRGDRAEQQHGGGDGGSEDLHWRSFSDVRFRNVQQAGLNPS
jgi:hypothetical protein